MKQVGKHPFGMALLAYHNGQKDAKMIIRRDDGLEVFLPARHFFREPEEFSRIEQTALGYCIGSVLDIGGGGGTLSLFLQSKGHPVTAIDIDPGSVSVMKKRGIYSVFKEDIFLFSNGTYDTLLLLGHGIGITGNLNGLERFLDHCLTLGNKGCRIICDSMDVRVTKDIKNQVYHEWNLKAGRSIGEINMQIEFDGIKGPFLNWLHVEYPVLEQYARKSGWSSKRLMDQENGEYLALLERS